MGNWQIVINGHGIHDNGIDGDADAVCGRFLAELAKTQDSLTCTFTPTGVPVGIPVPVAT